MYNFSYHSILVIWVYTLVASTRFAAVSLGWKDNVNPRVAVSEMEKSGKYKPAVIAKLRRREAAHQNAYEAMPMFCAAVVSWRFDHAVFWCYAILWVLCHSLIPLPISASSAIFPCPPPFAPRKDAFN